MITIADIKDKLDALRLFDAPLTDAMRAAISGLVCKVDQDEDGHDWPEDDWDFAFTGRFLIKHRNYSFGKENKDLTPEQITAITKRFKVKNAVFLLDHSGLTASFRNFAETFDPGGRDTSHIGFWVLDTARLKKMGLRLKKRSRKEQIAKWQEQDIDLLNQWLQNDIWDARVEWDGGRADEGVDEPDIDLSDHGGGGLWCYDYAENEAKGFLLAAAKDVCEAAHWSAFEQAKRAQTAWELHNPSIPGLLAQVAS